MGSRSSMLRDLLEKLRGASDKELVRAVAVNPDASRGSKMNWHEFDVNVAAALEAQTEQVRRLCEAIGYGRVMHDAERLWAEKARASGQPGSEHSIGPCASFLVACPCIERDGPGCEWCEGSRRVTKRVREAMLHSDHR